jgi:hypothetical protein
MALTIAQSGTAGPGTTATSIGAGAAQINITDAARQTLYIAVVFDDQGDSSGRTLTASFGGADLASGLIRRAAQSGPFFAVYHKTDPASGSLQDFLLSASAAFANRQWYVIFVVANDNSQATPYDGLQFAESTTNQSSTTAVTSATGRKVLSFLVVDNKTVGSCGPNTGTLIQEINVSGGVYLGAAVYDGASTVNTSWGDGVGGNWTGTLISDEISFSLNEDTGAGAATPPLVVPAKFVRGARVNRKRRAA